MTTSSTCALILMIRTRFYLACANKVEIREYQSHAGRCYEYATNSTLLTLQEEDKAHMMFKSHKNKLKRPYIVHADTEGSLVRWGLG